MTTEIVVMNREAIAIAADSAVTVSGQKVFPTANKIFALSKYHPVGVMIYNSAAISGIPWEPLIKLYRKRLGRTSYDHLHQYVDDFIKYVQSCKTLVDQGSQDKFAYFKIYNLCILLREEFRSRLKKRYLNQNFTLQEAQNVLDEAISMWESRLSGLKTTKIFVDFSKSILNQTIPELFESLPLTSKEFQRILNLSSQYLANPQTTSFQVYSGIVICGYGEKEIFPASCNITIEGFIKNRLIHHKESCAVISHQNHAHIRAFAQSDMIQVFMDGIHEKIKTQLGINARASIANLLRNLIPKLKLNKIQQKQLSTLSSEIKTEIDSFNSRIDDLIQTELSGPTVNIVSSLPKSELSTMAETLVNLTSFRRKMSMDNETVGGPIDVAVISKGDGFVWIKRKFYFPKDLNYAFYQHYNVNFGDGDD